MTQRTQHQIDASSEVAPHSATARVLHWGFIAVFIYALTKQLDEVDELEDLALLEYEMVFAGLFLMLLIARYLYMRATRPSAMPPATPRRQRLLARAVHLGMYLALGLVAVSGLVIGGLYGSGTKEGPAMSAALALHEIFVNTSYVLIIGHVAAAVYHRQLGDGIWGSMVPIWSKRKQQ